MDFNYKKLLDILLQEKRYEDLVCFGSSEDNLLKKPEYKHEDEEILRRFNDVIARGNIQGELWEQAEKSKDTFRHMCVNRRFSEGNKYRLYLCPKKEELYGIINEIMARCCKSKNPVYIKYSREARYDRIVFFCTSPEDLKDKIKLLQEIKKDHPAWFEGMPKSDAWLSESPFPGAYMGPEKLVCDFFGNPYSSYTKAFEAMMANIANEMSFHFMTDIEKLKKKPINVLLPVFEYYFKRELGKFGLYIFFDKDGQLSVKTNSLFPGEGNSIDEQIFRKKHGIEIAKHYTADEVKYYMIPFVNKIPNSQEELDQFNYYIMSPEEHWNRMAYPHLYENTGGGLGTK